MRKEDELVVFGIRPLLRGKLAVSFREGTANARKTKRRDVSFSMS